MRKRVEKDYLGKKNIPADSYYGIQTERALENFSISYIKPHSEFIKSTALIKLAAAKANMIAGLLDSKRGNAIARASQEVVDGKLHHYFVVDVFQAGAGTSHNMNANEVIANRAIEILGGKKGDYKIIDPHDHVNKSQSTNDTYPTTMRITCLSLTEYLLKELEGLVKSFNTKAKQFDNVIKSGRTHLMDAAPIRLGQEFKAYADMLAKDKENILSASKKLLELNIGATAIGTGLNADPRYVSEMIKNLSKLTGFKLYRAKDLVEITQSMEDFVVFSSVLKALAIDLTKICNDIRLMGSGPTAGLAEIKIPAVQPGSSIMPGKINPSIAECMNMICYQIMGNDSTITLAAQAGQFELNVMMPLIAYNLIFSLQIMKNGLKMLREKLVDGIQANREWMKFIAEKSYGIAMALNPYLGYNKTAELVKIAMKKHKTLREIVLEKKLMTKEELDKILDVYALTEMGIAGKRKVRK